MDSPGPLARVEVPLVPAQLWPCAACRVPGTAFIQFASASGWRSVVQAARSAGRAWTRSRRTQETWRRASLIKRLQGIQWKGRPAAHPLRPFDDVSRSRTAPGRQCVIDARDSSAILHTTRLMNWITGFSIVHTVALQGHVYADVCGCLCCTLELVSHIHLAIYCLTDLPSHQTNLVKPPRAKRESQA